MDHPEREWVACSSREEIARALSQWRAGAHLAAEFDIGQRRARYAEAVERVVAQLQGCTTLQQLIACYFAQDGTVEDMVARACQAAARHRRFQRSSVAESVVRDAALWCRTQQLVACAARRGDAK